MSSGIVARGGDGLTKRNIFPFLVVHSQPGESHPLLFGVGNFDITEFSGLRSGPRKVKHLKLRIRSFPNVVNLLAVVVEDGDFQTYTLGEIAVGASPKVDVDEIIVIAQVHLPPLSFRVSGTVPAIAYTGFDLWVADGYFCSSPRTMVISCRRGRFLS